MRHFLITFLLLVSCTGLRKWQLDHPDNFVEEMIEEFIEDKTNFDVDLTPFTGEEKQGLDIYREEFK